jgi:outer membrane protein assembly factor BamE
MPRFYTTIVLIFVAGLSWGCQSSPLKDYQSLHPGMEKNDVLGIMGSPQRTERFHGKDRWTYVFYDNNLRFEKEIQFFEGNAVYLGDPWQPQVSAIEVDAKNEALNKAVEEDLIKKYEGNPAAYSKYESDIRGTDKVRYVPQFQPLR